MRSGDKIVVPGAAWVEVIRRPTLEAFTPVFANEAMLEASRAANGGKGSESIRAAFAATASMYESIAFTDETTQGSKAYLEWACAAQVLSHVERPRFIMTVAA